MTGRVECRYYGRDFTAGELALLRALIAVDPQPTRAGLSREFCRLIGWFKQLAEFICGDDKETAPLYRSSSMLTRFFETAGLPRFIHDGSNAQMVDP